jgi:pimeloyl-ACP methyl ester carboxylesterase
MDDSSTNSADERQVLGPGITLQRNPRNNAVNAPGLRPLVLMLGWMFSQDRHLERYRQIYFEHGYDVLTVQSTPLKLLWPTLGSQVIARDVVNYLRKVYSNYSYISVHGFSVGGYQLGETLVELDKLETELREKVTNKFRGVITDSCVDICNVPYGLSRAITSNIILASMIQFLIATYLFINYFFVTIHYLKSSQTFHALRLRCPCLIISSRADEVGTVEQNDAVAASWRKGGHDVDVHVFELSEHVANFQKYPDEYLSLINNFLNRIKPIKNC